jgi:ribonuclease P protein component
VTTPRYSFSKAMRIRSKLEFDAVFERRQRAFAGPLAVYIAPNGLTHTRLGISMSRRVGNAVQRNRIKRMLREAFRLQQVELPAGWDLVVVPRAHAPLTLQQYMDALREAADRARAKGA